MVNNTKQGPQSFTVHKPQRESLKFQSKVTIYKTKNGPLYGQTK